MPEQAATNGWPVTRAVMVVAMSLAGLLAFGQITLALVLLYICGYLLALVRRSNNLPQRHKGHKG